MSKNVGKIFEQDFSKCVPNYAGILRIPDSAQSFNRSSFLRFSVKNPFDYLIWNPKTLTLYALELKTVKGKSISFERSKEEHGEIHFHQIEGLRNFARVGKCVCGFVIEFRELETTVFVSIEEFLRLSETITKKSFSYKDLNDYGIEYVIIPQSLAKTHYKYGVESFLRNTGLNKPFGDGD